MILDVIIPIWTRGNINFYSLKKNHYDGSNIFFVCGTELLMFTRISRQVDESGNFIILGVGVVLLVLCFLVFHFFSKWPKSKTLHYCFLWHYSNFVHKSWFRYMVLGLPKYYFFRNVFFSHSEHESGLMNDIKIPNSH